MTQAVCIKCGAFKHGGFSPCGACGFEPDTETDAAYSLALTDHYFPMQILEEISASIQGGRPHPTLPPHQEAGFREACRPYLRVQAKRRAQMAKARRADE